MKFSLTTLNNFKLPLIYGIYPNELITTEILVLTIVKKFIVTTNLNAWSMKIVWGYEAEVTTNGLVDKDGPKNFREVGPVMQACLNK